MQVLIHADPTTSTPTGETVIVLDEFNVLHRGDDWVALSDIQAALAVPLLGALGSRRVVGVDQLRQAAWSGGQAGAGALRSQIARLRAKLGRIGVRLSTVRGRGLVVEDDRDARSSGRPMGSGPER